MHHAQLKFARCLEQNVVFMRQLPPLTCRYFQNLLLLKKVSTSLHFKLVDKPSDQSNAE